MSEFDSKVLKKVQHIWGQHQNKTDTTQLKAADAMGINQSAYSQYIRGKIPLNAQFLHKFSQFTGEPLESFGVTGDVPSQDLRVVNLDVKYTLSGKKLSGESLAVKSLVPHDECYLVRVDYSDHVFAKGSHIVVDGKSSLVEDDFVVFIGGNCPLVFGYLHQCAEGWEIHEPHWFGGRTHVVDQNDAVNKALCVMSPESKGAVFRK